MKQIRKFFIVVMILVLAFSMNAAAKTTKAASTSLKDVRHAATVTGTWKKTGSGTKLLLADGTYQKSGWVNVNGSIYYLNKKNVRVSGWILYRKAYYYAGSKTGKLMTGWIKNNTYYLKQDYRRAKGLTTIGSDKYYFSTKNGKKQTGWVKIKSKLYYFDKKSGKMIKGQWIKYGSSKRYVGTDGIMLKSTWMTLNGKKYFLDSSGLRVTGEQYINGKWYYFDKYGVYNPKVKINTTINPNKKMVALTFDDGPGPYTQTLLTCLRKNQAKATFFMVGSNVGNYKSTVKQMAAQGCELGNHSYTHAYMDSLSTSGIKSEFSRTSDKIKAACGKKPTVARLPYGSGASNSRVLNAIGLPSIYWSLDTRDWANTGSPQHTVNEVLNHVKDGDIVLMHDIHSSTVTAAKSIIPALKNRGYQMVTVTELAKYKGKKSLKAGTTYYHF